LRPTPLSLLDKSEFVGLEQVTHLATGGEAPWLRSHDQATARMGALKSGGMAGREQLFVVYERAIVWGGEGRIRVSTHVYNDRGDVRRLLDVLDSLRRREARAGA
jgi:selenocysteine lyase/cysteine desulfurase